MEGERAYKTENNKSLPNPALSLSLALRRFASHRFIIGCWFDGGLELGKKRQEKKSQL